MLETYNRLQADLSTSTWSCRYQAKALFHVQTLEALDEAASGWKASQLVAEESKQCKRLSTPHIGLL